MLQKIPSFSKSAKLRRTPPWHTHLKMNLVILSAKPAAGQNLSHSEIAAAAGITAAELARMEQYTLKPTETQVFRLAEVLNLGRCETT